MTISKMLGVARKLLAGLHPQGLSSAGQNSLHFSTPRPLPKAALLRLPDNVQDINAETGCFSQLRNRDISGLVISSFEDRNIDITLDSDPHIGAYDCRGALSLSSSMQSNVPSPFGGQRCILSMPGSQLGQGYKYVSDKLHTLHYLNLREEHRGSGFRTGMDRRLYHTVQNDSHRTEGLQRRFSTSTSNDNKPLTRRQKLQQAVATYGSTVIVFHVTISLISLGGFYLLVSSGLDVMALMDSLGFADDAFSKKITANAGTFVVAYAVHKVFAPVRIGITLTSTPFIVRYLRNIGILKKPQK